MKLILVLFIFTLFSNSASAIFQSKINASFKNKPLKDVLAEIENTTDYKFLYRTDLIDLNVLASIDISEGSIETALTTLLKSTKINYSLVDQTLVVLSPKQDRKITGIVKDQEGIPLIGVTVKLKENGKIAVTDEKGFFTVEAADTVKNIVFSYIGMLNQEISISNRTQINVIMQQDAFTLSDVVVTGFQNRSREQMVGAVSLVKSEEFESASVTTIDKVLTGKLSGVYIRSNSGSPGEVAEIQIRGINTMSGNTQPLYILDGMPLQSGNVSGSVSEVVDNGIGNIPPEDIESITILKDATAAAIYGSQAANGVVVITTKKGSIGKDYIKYSGKFGLNEQPRNKFAFMNSEQKIAFERGIYRDYRPIYGGQVVQLLNRADNGVISKEAAEAKISELAAINTDWMDEIYNTGLSHSHNLTLSGGSTKMQYYASANYQYQEGTLMGNDYSTGGLNLKLSNYVRPDLLVRFNLYSTLKKTEKPTPNIDPFKYAAFANTYEKPYNEDGSYAYDMSFLNLTNDVGTSSDLSYKTLNIIRELKENMTTTLYCNVRGLIDVEYKFLKMFKFTSSAAMDYTSTHNMSEVYPGTYKSYATNWYHGNRPVLPEFNLGQLSEDMSRAQAYTFRSTLEFTKTVKKHFVQTLLASEITGRSSNWFSSMFPIYTPEYRIVGYPTWADINSTTTGDMISSKYNTLFLSRFGSSNVGKNRGASFIGSLIYSYDNKYVLNGNWRFDGVDIIGSNNQFTPLWSAGVRWNAQNEKFLKPFRRIINRLVVSAGYGYRGSINRTAYPFNSFNLSVRNYDGVAIAGSITYGNPALKWERKGEKTIGLEFSLFNGRINFDGQYYDENVKDLLDQAAIPASLGRTSVSVNIGNLTNKGFELTTRIVAFKTRDFSLEVGGNITSVKNMLVKSYKTVVPNYSYNYPSNVQGYPVNSWFGYKFDSINQNNGHAMVWAQRTTSETINGVLTYKYADELIDLDGMTASNLLANYSTYHLGQLNPKLYGGFNLRAVYKNFELQTQFVYATGQKIIGFQDRLNGPSGQTDDITASRTNRLIQAAYRWRQPGDITNIPIFSNSVSNYSRFLIDTDLSEGSYLKCSSMTLSWRARKQLLDAINLQELRIAFMANNLFTVTNYMGTDPETRTPFGYPITRQYTLSFSIGF
jgi:TonB-linked SusC/RagA family outer membrane protein